MLSLIMFKKIWFYIRYGKVTKQIVAFEGDHIPSEVEYKDRFGNIIGYWAFGSFDTSMPYHGEQNES